MLDATFWSYIRKFRITFYQSQNKLPFIHILIFFRTRKILRSPPISLLRYIKDTSDRKTGLGLFLQYPSPQKNQTKMNYPFIWHDKLSAGISFYVQFSRIKVEIKDITAFIWHLTFTVILLIAKS